MRRLFTRIPIKINEESQMATTQKEVALAIATQILRHTGAL